MIDSKSFCFHATGGFDNGTRDTFMFFLPPRGQHTATLVGVDLNILVGSQCVDAHADQEKSSTRNDNNDWVGRRIAQPGLSKVIFLVFEPELGRNGVALGGGGRGGHGGLGTDLLAGDGAENSGSEGVHDRGLD